MSLDVSSVAERWPESTTLSARGVAALAFVVPCVAAPLLFAGVFAWTRVAIAVLFAGTCIAYWVVGGRDALLRRSDPIVWASVVALLWTTLQMIPLPCSLVSAISPEAARLHTAAQRLVHRDAAPVCHLSYAPGQTLAELLTGVTIFASYIAAIALVRWGRRRAILRSIALSAVVLGAITLAHALIGADRVFGVYRPVYAATPLLSPVLNPNHLGGLFAMGSLLCLGLGLSADKRDLRPTWLVGSVMLVGMTLLSRSRGAIASLCAFLVVYAGLVALRKRRTRAGHSLAAPIALGVSGLGILVGIYIAFDEVTQDFTAGDLSKLDLAERAFHLALKSPWVGVGRGAFGYTLTRELASPVRYSHAESLPAQWLADWGIAAPAIAALIALGLWYGFRETRHSVLQLSALCALGVLVAQNLLDFSLEYPAAAALAAALVGACAAPSASRSVAPQAYARDPIARRGTAAVVVSLGAIVVLAAPVVLARDRLKLETEITAAREAGFANAPNTALAAAVRWYPADAAFPLQWGALDDTHDDPRALLWYHQTSRLAPGWAAPHLASARFLFRHHQDPLALAALRRGVERDAGLSEGLVRWYARTRRDVHGILEAAPNDAVARQRYIELVVRELGPMSPEANVLDSATRAALPDDIHVRFRDGLRQIAAGNQDAGFAALEDLRRNAGDNSELAASVAELYIQHRRPDDALRVLGEVQRDRRVALEAAMQSRILIAQAKAHAARNDGDSMRRAIDGLLTLAVGSTDRYAEAYRLLAHLESALGNSGRAFAALEQSLRTVFQPDIAQQAAELATRLGDLHRAYQLQRELCERTQDDRACATQTRLRSTLLEGEP